MATTTSTSTPRQDDGHPQQARNLQRLNTGDRTNAVRLVALADRSLAGPVASLFVGHAFGMGAMGGMGMGGGGGGMGASNSRGNGSGSGSGSADASPTHLNGGGGGSGNGGGIRFTTTRTEDAMDSVLPTAAEDLLSRAVLAPTARFAAHKLSFDLASEGRGGGRKC